MQVTSGKRQPWPRGVLFSRPKSTATGMLCPALASSLATWVPGRLGCSAPNLSWRPARPAAPLLKHLAFPLTGRPAQHRTLRRRNCPRKGLLRKSPDEKRQHPADYSVVQERARRDSADLAGARSAAKFVVEVVGDEYDAPEIEPNRKSRLNWCRFRSF
jgi:hypothetical protein